MLSLSDLVQALKMADGLSIWAGLPLYGIGYGVAIWVIAFGLAKLWNVVVSWIGDVRVLRGANKVKVWNETPWYLRIARWAVVLLGIAYGSGFVAHSFKEWFGF